MLTILFYTSMCGKYNTNEEKNKVFTAASLPNLNSSVHLFTHINLI